MVKIDLKKFDYLLIPAGYMTRLLDKNLPGSSAPFELLGSDIEGNKLNDKHESLKQRYKNRGAILVCDFQDTMVTIGESEDFEELSKMAKERLGMVFHCHTASRALELHSAINFAEFCGFFNSICDLEGVELSNGKTVFIICVDN
jgi:hypothetical protein